MTKEEIQAIPTKELYEMLTDGQKYEIWKLVEKLNLLSYLSFTDFYEEHEEYKDKKDFIENYAYEIWDCVRESINAGVDNLDEFVMDAIDYVWVEEIESDSDKYLVQS